MKVLVLATSALVLATAAAQSTPAPTTTAPKYNEELGCWPISVEHDATYCIDGPICSGSGAEPAGWQCPVAGDKAIADCHSYLVSYEDGDDCTLPVDATCQVIHTGAWGCVISGATPSPTSSTTPGSTPKPGTPGTSKPTTPGTSKPGTPGTSKPTTPGTSKPTTPAPTTNGTHPGNSTNATSSEDITFSSVANVASSGSVSAGAIAAIAAAAAVVCAVVGTAIYNKYRRTEPTVNDETLIQVQTP